MSELHAPASLPPVTADEPLGGAARRHAASSPDFTGITPPRRRGGAARFITDVIVELGFVPKEKVDAAVEQGRATHQTPEQVLLESGVLGADQLARATAERFGLDHVDLTVYKPDIAAVNLLAPRRPSATTRSRSASTTRATCSSRWRTRRTCSRSTTSS